MFMRDRQVTCHMYSSYKNVFTSRGGRSQRKQLMCTHHIQYMETNLNNCFLLIYFSTLYTCIATQRNCIIAQQRMHLYNTRQLSSWRCWAFCTYTTNKFPTYDRVYAIAPLQLLIIANLNWKNVFLNPSMNHVAPAHSQLRFVDDAKLFRRRQNWRQCGMGVPHDVSYHTLFNTVESVTPPSLFMQTIVGHRIVSFIWHIILHYYSLKLKTLSLGMVNEIEKSLHLFCTHLASSRTFHAGRVTSKKIKLLSLVVHGKINLRYSHCIKSILYGKF